MEMDSVTKTPKQIPLPRQQNGLRYYHPLLTTPRGTRISPQAGTNRGNVQGLGYEFGQRRPDVQLIPGARRRQGDQGKQKFVGKLGPDHLR
jgi:hypothetical protein